MESLSAEALQQFATLLANYEKRLGALERAKQPFTGDWIELNQNDFSYNSSNVLNVPGFDATTRFKPGTRFKIIQGGVTKYFYGIDNQVATLAVSGGSDYVYTNDTITYIAYSNNVPLDFPDTFTYVPTFTFINISGGNATTVVGEFFFINGHLLFRGSAAITWTGSAPGPEIQITTPFDISSLSGYSAGGAKPYMSASLGEYNPRVSSASATKLAIHGATPLFVGGGAGSTTLYFSLLI